MSETREDVLREFRTTSPCDAETCAACGAAVQEMLAAEILRLRALIDDAAVPWMALDPGIAWEGAIDAAMAAACAEITRLRDEARGVRAVEKYKASNQSDPSVSDVGDIESNGNGWSAIKYTASGSRTVAEAPTLAALGLELLKQGRVTL